jgi:hypothetical protein
MIEGIIFLNIFFNFIFSFFTFMMSSYFFSYSLRFLKLVEEHKRNETICVIDFSRFSFRLI